MHGEIPYVWTLLLALVRAGGVAFVAFVVLTRLTLPGTQRESSLEGRMWGDAVLGLSTALVVALALGVTGLFDAASLVAALGLALAGGAWLRYRKLWRRTLLRQYARLLQWIERIAPPPSLVPGPAGERFRRSLDDALSEPTRTRAPFRPWALAVAGVAVTAVIVRLIPAFAEPAPFSLRYYASLETLKGLQVGAPTGSEAGWGLPALVLALSELARIDPSLLLRGVGAIAMGAVCYGVYQTARYFWARPAGAFAGALFVAVGGPWLPVPLDRQVGAEPLLLAAALALPVFPHIATYLGTGSRRGVTVGIAGLAATGFVYPSVGALLLGLVSLHVLGIVAQVVVRRRVQKKGHRGRYRDRYLARRTWTAAGLAAVTAALWVAYSVLLRRLSQEGSFVFFEVARPEVGVPVALALGIGGLLVLAPFAPARDRFLSHLPRPGALIRNGLQTIALTALWVSTGAGAEGLSGGAAVLLLCALGLGVGLLMSEAVAWAALGWRRLATSGRPRTVAIPQWAPATVALVVGAVAVGSGWGAPQRRAPVEPAGFVAGYHALERVSLPYAWTAISHVGTGIRVRNRGRFMDYEYFLATYDPASYDHTGPGAIPTPDLFFFLERGDAPTAVRDELRPPGRQHNARLRSWLDQYRARPDQAGHVSVLYQDSDVEVVRVSRPAPTLLELPPDSLLASRSVPPHATHIRR